MNIGLIMRSALTSIRDRVATAVGRFINDHRAMFGVVVFLALAGPLVAITSWYSTYSENVIEGVLIEMHGVVVEVAIIGALLVWLTSWGDRVATVRALLQQLDSYRNWNAPGVAPRTVDVVRRLLLLKAGPLDLRGCSLAGADLSGLDLRGANLTDADLEATRLIGTTLTNATLRRTNMTAADLSHAVLVGAILEDVVIVHATFTGANLNNAALSGIGPHQALHLCDAVPFTPAAMDRELQTELANRCPGVVLVRTGG